MLPCTEDKMLKMIKTIIAARKRSRMFIKNDQHSKKGDYGESLVEKFLEDKKCKLIHKHIDGNADEAHKIDYLYLSDKFPPDYFYVEVKTKNHRNSFPDVGINKTAYRQYIKLDKIHPVYLFIVDASEGYIYGNKLSILDTVNGYYPIEDKNCRYFPLNKMIKYCRISKEDVIKLNDLSFK